MMTAAKNARILRRPASHTSSVASEQKQGVSAPHRTAPWWSKKYQHGFRHAGLLQYGHDLPRFIVPRHPP